MYLHSAELDSYIFVVDCQMYVQVLSFLVLELRVNAQNIEGSGS